MRGARIAPPIAAERWSTPDRCPHRRPVRRDPQRLGGAPNGEERLKEVQYMNAEKQYMNADKFNQTPRLLYAMLSILLPQFGATAQRPACGRSAMSCQFLKDPERKKCKT